MKLSYNLEPVWKLIKDLKLNTEKLYGSIRQAVEQIEKSKGT